MDASREQIREQMAEIQEELRAALEAMLAEVGDKLSEEEQAKVKAEFQELDGLLDRLKTGLVWVTLFGRVTVGKSALTNALMQQDVAEVNIKHGSTREVTAYERAPWKIVDVPGVLDEKVMQTIALEEARKSHGHIFVLDSEPSQPELELFDLICEQAPEAPKIVFYNKFDLLQNVPKADREQRMVAVKEKMRRYVDSPQDIVFGSAAVFDPASDVWARQEVPELLDRLYEGAGTLGQIMGVLDPAQRAHDLASSIREKVLDVRTSLARKIVAGFAAAAVPSGAIPFSSVTVSPSLMGSMIYTIFRVMGSKDEETSKAKVGAEFIKTCGQLFGAEVGVATGLEIVSDVFEVVVPWWGTLITFAGLSAYRYNRAAVLGELAIEYARNDFSWGGESSEVIFSRCKERAKRYHQLFKKEES